MQCLHRSDALGVQMSCYMVTVSLVTAKVQCNLKQSECKLWYFPLRTLSVGNKLGFFFFFTINQWAHTAPQCASFLPSSLLSPFFTPTSFSSSHSSFPLILSYLLPPPVYSPPPLVLPLLLLLSCGPSEFITGWADSWLSPTSLESMKACL